MTVFVDLVGVLQAVEADMLIKASSFLFCYRYVGMNMLMAFMLEDYFC